MNPPSQSLRRDRLQIYADNRGRNPIAAKEHKERKKKKKKNLTQSRKDAKGTGNPE
jgi:hypothetical protein